MCLRSCQIKSTISGVTSLKRSSTSDPTVSTQEQQRWEVSSGCRWRPFARLERVIWLEERETEIRQRPPDRKEQHNPAQGRTHTHKLVFYGQDRTDGRSEKGSIHLQSDIRKGYPTSTQTAGHTHTHTRTQNELRWSWGKQLPKMTFQGFVFHIQNRKHCVCACVCTRERLRRMHDNITLFEGHLLKGETTYTDLKSSHTHSHLVKADSAVYRIRYKYAIKL